MTVRRLIAFIFYLIPFAPSISAQPSFFKMWDNVYGGNDDDISSIILCDKSGNIYNVGVTQSDSSGTVTQQGKGYLDYWVVKTNADGAIVWDKRFGGTGREYAYTAILDAKNNLLIGGVTNSPVSGDVEQPGYGGDDYWVVLVDSNGNKIWTKRYGGPSDEYMYASALSSDGGYLLGGYGISGVGGVKTEPNKSHIPGTADMWIIKIDSLGSIMWDRDIGTSSDESLYQLRTFSDGSYLLAGGVDTTVDFDRSSPGYGNTDLWLLKVDTGGHILWEKSYGGSYFEETLQVDTTADKGFVIAGLSYSDSSGNKYMPDQADYWVIRCDSNGNILWENSYGGDYTEKIRSVQVVENGDILLTGLSQSDMPSGEKSEANLTGTQAWVIKVNKLGQKLWDKTIFTYKEQGITGGLEMPDGCYVVGETSNSPIGGYKTHPSFTAPDSSRDYWLIKFCMGTVDAPTLSPDAGLQLNIYPSPFTDELTITLHNNPGSTAVFTITNVMGQILYQRSELHLANNYTKALDLSPLPPGPYFVTVTVGDKKVVRQMVKQ